MEEVHFSQSDIHEPPLKRAYMTITGILLFCFLLGFCAFNFWMVVHFREERLKDLHGDVTDQALHLDFSLFALAQSINHLELIFEKPPTSSRDTLASLLTPLPTLSAKKFYGRVSLPSVKKSALIDVGQRVSSLETAELFLLACLFEKSEKKILGLLRLFPDIDSIMYISSNIRFFFPWDYFPPQVDPFWVQQAYNLQFALLKSTKNLGWRPLTCQNSNADWTISYVYPHKRDDQLWGFFALTIKPLFFQNVLERLYIPFGRCIIIDGEDKKILHKDADGFNFESIFLNEALPSGLSAKDILHAPPGKMVYHRVTWFKGYWTSIIPLAKTPFKVMFFCDSWDLFKRQVADMAFQILWEFIILTVLFVLNYKMIQRFFTLPLTALMAHMNHERLGLKTSIEHFSSTWRTWAQLISAIFHEKRARASELEIRLQERSTELRQTIERLQNSQKQMIAQEKLVGLGTLATGIAHELKNPLHFVINFATLCHDLLEDAHSKKDLSKDTLATLTENTQKIIHHAAQANGILNRILFHTRRQSEGIASVDLRLLAEEYTSICYQGYIAEMDPLPFVIEVSYDPQPLMIACYAKEIGRVFLNILGNAFDALSERFIAEKKRGNIYVPRLRVNVTRKGDRAILSFQDNGPGIPQQFLDQIFDPFFTTKDTGAGTGLGLSLSYDFTQRHGGSLDVTSQENKGTTFTLTFPLEETPAEALSPDIEPPDITS